MFSTLFLVIIGVSLVATSIEAVPLGEDVRRSDVNIIGGVAESLVRKGVVEARAVSSPLISLPVETQSDERSVWLPRSDLPDVPADDVVGDESTGVLDVEWKFINRDVEADDSIKWHFIDRRQDSIGDEATGVLDVKWKFIDRDVETDDDSIGWHFIDRRQSIGASDAIGDESTGVLGIKWKNLD